MAAWAGLGQVATVAQLVGVDAVGLISMILRAAATARQNRMECEQLARRVLMVAELLPLLQDPEAVRPLAGLGDALREAHELVVSCQGRSAAYQFVMAGRQAERFRDVQSRIDSYLIVFPIVSSIGITRRLDRIYNVLVPDDATISPSPLSRSSQLQLQESAEVPQEIPHGTEEFTLAEIVAATNNFALDNRIGEGRTEYREEYNSRKYLMLLGILAARVTYQAGLATPTVVWQDDGDHGNAGDPLLRGTDGLRYGIFFYSNFTSIVASVVVIALQQIRRDHERRNNELLLLGTMPAVLLDLVGLLVAYVASSTWQWPHAVVLAAMVLLCMATCWKIRQFRCRRNGSRTVSLCTPGPRTGML